MITMWDSISKKQSLLLGVSVVVGSGKFCFVVGHHPLLPRSCMKLRPRQCLQASTHLLHSHIPADANARVDAKNVTDRLRAATAVGDRAHCLQQFAGAHKLCAGPLFDELGKRQVTWTAPHGSQSQIDYVLVPMAVTAGIVSAGRPSRFVDPSGFDHSPLQLHLQWMDKASPAAKLPAIDAARIRTPEGQAQLAAIYQCLHVIPCDFLFAELCAVFPMRQSQPRQKQVSDLQWQAIRRRRHTRRLLFQCKNMQKRLLLWQCMNAWRRNAPAVAAARRQALL